MTKIRPIVIYPFRHPINTDHLIALYLSLDNKHRTESKRYVKPVTVVNKQTYYRNYRDSKFMDMYKAADHWSSSVVDAWCVDTCQMWLAGFGKSFDTSLKSEEANEDGDVFWLIPGDFDYASENGKEVLKDMYQIPERVLGDAELCIGQLQMLPNSSKHLIDTYGTYGLLFNWFPAEASKIWENGIIHPRSEFFAIDHKFLRRALIDNRWFAYEQTIALLLQADGRKVSPIPLGNIVDPSESRDNLAGALQQIERTERVLKVAWRDLKINNKVNNWIHEFRLLEEQSREIIRAAMTILKNSL